MNSKRYDAGEMARAVLSEMGETDRVALMVDQARHLEGLEGVVSLINALTERAQEIIAERYADQLIGGAA